MQSEEKPHRGMIRNWRKGHWPTLGLGYVIEGIFEDHDVRYGHTSYVVMHDEETGEIETSNSRYTLVGKETL